MNGRKDLPGRRWLAIALRALHVAGVIDTAVGLFGQAATHHVGPAILLASGAALFALDCWQDRNLWREVAGVFVVLKLLLVFAMMLTPQFAGMIFWCLALSSAVVSHAPRSFRHRRVIG
mgnify:CR=1 FL=1